MGGAQDSGNLGVSALGVSAVELLGRHLPEADVAMEVRRYRTEAEVMLPEGRRVMKAVRLYYLWKPTGKYGTSRVGALLTAAKYLPDSLARQVVAHNMTAARIYEADAVLDVSAGDSFADIYGEWRFFDELTRKRLVMKAGKKLVLLPQTLGPFRTAKGVELASKVIEGALVVATREVGGIDEIARTMGDQCANRLSFCPDMAFAMTPKEVDLAGEPWAAPTEGTLVGMNVSGLLWKRDGSEFGLKADYTELTRHLARRLLAEAGTRLVLVPHVVGEQPLPEDRSQWPVGREVDTVACHALADELRDEFPGRVDVVRGFYGPSETKYLVGRCDFFIGARMHACIAAASQAIPHVLIAYSKKARGVFGVLGEGGCVVDPRADDLATCVDATMRAYANRDSQRAVLNVNVPKVVGEVNRFFGEVLAPAIRFGVAAEAR